MEGRGGGEVKGGRGEAEGRGAYPFEVMGVRGGDLCGGEGVRGGAAVVGV